MGKVQLCQVLFINSGFINTGMQQLFQRIRIHNVAASSGCRIGYKKAYLVSVLNCRFLGQKPMGRPADRSKGVVLVTDYGALDRALAQKARMEAKKEQK